MERDNGYIKKFLEIEALAGESGKILGYTAVDIEDLDEQVKDSRYPEANMLIRFITLTDDSNYTTMAGNWYVRVKEDVTLELLNPEEEPLHAPSHALLHYFESWVDEIKPDERHHAETRYIILDNALHGALTFTNIVKAVETFKVLRKSSAKVYLSKVIGSNR